MFIIIAGGMLYMIIKIFLFILPFSLFSSELIWSSKSYSEVTKQTYDEAISAYVKKTYPQKAKAYRNELFKKMQQQMKEKIKENTLTINGLMWQDNKDAKVVRRSWYSAKKYCANLRLFGFDNWQLPNIGQFKNIIDKSRRPAIKNGFKNVMSDYYWSSSSSRSYSKDAWRLNFKNGSVSHYYKQKSYYVRCVREVK